MNSNSETLIEQWRIHRKNLDDLEIRKAKYGLDAPISLLRQIEDETSALMELEQRLQKLKLPSNVKDQGEIDSQLYQIETEFNRASHIEELKTNENGLSIFLCHSSNDKPFVRKLYRRLKSDNFDPWLDEEKLLAGQEWRQEILKAVRKADVVIVCLSRGSVNKAGYVQKEIKDALDVADEQPEGTIFLIPLKLEECEVPERLSKWQWVNYFDENGYKRLFDALQKRARTR